MERGATIVRLSVAVLAGLVLVGVWSSDAPAQDRDRLESGEILVESEPVTGSEMPRVEVTAVIDAPRKKVWDVIIDCDNYWRWYSSLESSSLVRKADGKWICHEVVDLPFPLTTIESTVEVTFSKDKDAWKRTWKMIKGDYHTNEGEWVLETYGDDGSKTLASYSVLVDPAVSIPNGLKKSGQKNQMPEVIEDVRRAVGAN